MTDERIKLIIGSLLHDVGKIIYRTSDRRTHAESGYHFLKEETNIEDTEILNLHQSILLIYYLALRNIQTMKNL